MFDCVSRSPLGRTAIACLCFFLYCLWPPSPFEHIFPSACLWNALFSFPFFQHLRDNSPSFSPQLLPPLTEHDLLVFVFHSASFLSPLFSCLGMQLIGGPKAAFISRNQVPFFYQPVPEVCSFALPFYFLAFGSSHLRVL